MQNRQRTWAYLVYRLTMLLRPYWLEGCQGGREVARAVIEAGGEVHPDDARTNGTLRSIRNDWLKQIRVGFNEAIDYEIGE